MRLAGGGVERALALAFPALRVGPGLPLAPALAGLQDALGALKHAPGLVDACSRTSPRPGRAQSGIDSPSWPSASSSTLLPEWAISAAISLASGDLPEPCAPKIMPPHGPEPGS